MPVRVTHGSSRSSPSRSGVTVLPEKIVLAAFFTAIAVDGGTTCHPIDLPRGDDSLVEEVVAVGQANGPAAHGPQMAME